jgi:aryl-alcohol dehydrogenase-like predicted oxidoreductase
MQMMTLWNGRRVPRIGVGCWAIGGADYGEVFDYESLAGLRLAFDMGARVFDTAAAYGWGRSERLLGLAFGDREDVVIVTKFGHPASSLSPGTIRASIELSRANLRRDRIDLALFHVNEHPPGEAGFVFDTLEELRARGWIGAFGWSTDYVPSARAFADRDGFVAIENDLNVFVPADEMMAFAAERRLVALNRLPLAMGLLSGKYNAGASVSAGDIRARDVEWMKFFKAGKGHPEFVKRLEAIREVLTTGGRTLAQGALGWILAHSPQALPVPGFKTEAQVRDNLGALEKGPLPPAAMAEINQLLKEAA